MTLYQGVYEVRGQFVGVSSLFLPYHGSWVLNSDHQGWWPVP